MSTELERLVAALPEKRVVGEPRGSVEAIVADSREARAGSLFVALRGENVDGHRFAERAVASGSLAVVTEIPLELPAGVVQIVVPDTRVAASRLAAEFFGHPSRALDVIGITGTNGKTTTAHLLASVLEAHGTRTGIVGTLGAMFERHGWPLANTTPLALELQALLAQMCAEGARDVVMEVSSHALALDRVADVEFRVGVLTNVSRDHLDFHKTFEAYAAAKRRLFERAASLVLNADDPLGARWSSEFRPHKAVLTYGVDNAADVRPSDLDVGAAGSTFLLAGQRFEVGLPGSFNVSNALAAIAAARVLGLSDRETADGLRAIEGVPGRMERIAGDGIDVVVDYAHTPDALERVLRVVRATTRGRLIAVFGCGGDRDAGKRPAMGKIAAEIADFVVVTSDNPRSEDPRAIVDAVIAPLDARQRAADRLAVVLDRRQAIQHAIAEAHRGDAVVIAGKGHETYQRAGGQTIHFDDREEARAALALHAERKAPA